MIKTLVVKPKLIKTKANNYTVKEKKTEIVIRLQMAIEKLKEAWKEINTTVQLTMNLKENGDDITEQVMIGVVEAVSINTNFSELKNGVQEKT